MFASIKPVPSMSAVIAGGTTRSIPGTNESFSSSYKINAHVHGGHEEHCNCCEHEQSIGLAAALLVFENENSHTDGK